MEMCEMLWRLQLPSEDGKGTTSTLFQYNTLYELRLTHQTQQRFNDVAMDTAATSFTKHRADIGPFGQSFLCQLSDGGKTNKNNNRHYTGTLPHRNPLVCAIFARGGLLLHRCFVYTIRTFLYVVQCLPADVIVSLLFPGFSIWRRAFLTGNTPSRCMRCTQSDKERTKQNPRPTNP